MKAFVKRFVASILCILVMLSAMPAVYAETHTAVPHASTEPEVCVCKYKCGETKDPECTVCNEGGTCAGLTKVEVNSWSALKAACANTAYQNGQYCLCLTADIQVENASVEASSVENIKIPQGKKMAIDLNGHKVAPVDATSGTAIKTGFVGVFGTLIIWDTAGGGGFEEFQATPIFVDENGYCLMQDVESLKCNVSFGGVVFIGPDGTFEMKNSAIVGEHTNPYEIIIAVQDRGTLKLSNGASVYCCDDSSCISTSAFRGENIFVNSTATIQANGGTVTCGVTNNGTITSSGNTPTEFTKDVKNYATISGGTYSGNVINDGGSITGGTFKGDVNNDGGSISGGVFYNEITGQGTIEDTAYITVTYDTDGGTSVPSERFIRGTLGSEAYDKTTSKDGRLFTGWSFNGGRFDTEAPMTDNITLKAAWAELDISGEGLSDTDYEYTFRTLTIKTAKAVTVQNIDKTKPTQDVIVIAEDISANVTLNGVNIQAPDEWEAFTDDNGVVTTEGRPAFEIEDGNGNVKVTLADNSVNTLKGGMYYAALQKGVAGTLTLHGNGSLNCTGSSEGAAGIGGMSGSSAKNITVEGGVITATGGEGAAGIGGGLLGSGENITVSGGTVKATGGTDATQPHLGAAGIGGGSNGNGKNITVSGGNVTAMGANACGIGGGASGTASDIKISGGTVLAVGDGNGFAFGAVPTVDSALSVSAGSSQDTLADVVSPTDATYTGNRAVKIMPGDIIADISWSSMSFVYSPGVWNTKTHTYVSSGWVGSGTVTVANSGNIPLSAEMSFTSAIGGITGNFDKTSFSIPVDGSDSSTLTLSGDPVRALDNDTVGSISLKIKVGD